MESLAGIDNETAGEAVLLDMEVPICTPFLVVEELAGRELAPGVIHLCWAFAASVGERSVAHSRELVLFSAKAALRSSAGLSEHRLLPAHRPFLQFQEMELEGAKLSSELVLAQPQRLRVASFLLSGQRLLCHLLLTEKLMEM
jgi:hypothetical protein